MLVTKNQAWGLGVAATLLTVISLLIVLWPHIGWTTPNQHQSDFLASSEIIKEFRDEWKCDEYEEELTAALERQEKGDNSIDTKRLIEKIRKKMEELKCSRFDDFG